MKKNTQDRQQNYVNMENILMAEIKTRRPLIEAERAELEQLIDNEIKSKIKRSTIKFTKENIARKQELERLNSYIRPGRKYFILSRNPNSVKKGKRFVFIDKNKQYQIGRVGTQCKVAMLPENEKMDYIKP